MLPLLLLLLLLLVLLNTSLFLIPAPHLPCYISSPRSTAILILKPRG